MGVKGRATVSTSEFLINYKNKKIEHSSQIVLFSNSPVLKHVSFLCQEAVGPTGQW